MSDSTVSQSDPSRDQIMSALFAHLVMQQSNMATMLLGKTPHPETGETIKDVETARMFIDLLEMIELKTKGNLNKEEAAILKNSLMATRMAFVESMNSPAPNPSEPRAVTPEAKASPEATPAESAPTSPASEEEHKKKFTKKY